MQIPVYVTLPPDRNKDERLPLIVLVHGGPWVRGGSWEWDDQPQFLATRGYAVVQPEFRGGTGFGYEHFHAGWHQWGLAMQDDLADAARWAIDQGYADPARIAIGGASYGGYATLMGLIKDPALFRCGFEFAGVTDIGLMYSISWSDASEEAKKFGFPTLIADPDKDAAQIAATSPVKNAQRLTQPLLMAHGAEDVRVPIKQGRKFRDAVSDTNKNVEWIVYSDEGHGFHQEEHRIDYWKHVEAFLDRCFKSAPAKVSDNRADPGAAPTAAASPR
jgi:dipeptidyl aminopeptidase/acylaminoacyl peptidase